MTDTAAQVFVKDLIAGDANSDVGVYSFRDFSVKNGPQAFSQDRNLPHPGRQSAPSCEIQEFRQTPAFPRMVQPMDFYGRKPKGDDAYFTVRAADFVLIYS